MILTHNNKVLTYNDKVLHNYTKVTRGVVFSYDFANRDCYPGTGDTVYDLSGNSRNGTITNNGGYTTANRGGLIFTGDKSVATGTHINCGTYTMPDNTYTQQFMYTWNTTLIGINSADFLMSGNWERLETHLFDFEYLGIQNKTRIIPAGVDEDSSDRSNDSAVDLLKQSHLNEDYTKKTTLITVVYDRTLAPGGYCNIYINSKLIEGTDSGYTRLYNVVNGPNFVDLTGAILNLKIGARNNKENSALDNRYFFNGTIYQADFFNVALTEAEVVQNFNYYRNRF